MTIVIDNMVKDALEQGAPVLALETGIITHALPHPLNLRVAQEIPRFLLDNGIVPATIGMINGDIKVGLTVEEITYLATEANLQRLSIRDLAIGQAHKLSGGVALAAVIHLANRVGIKVCASTGLGGIHRVGAKGMQESADLNALASHPMVLITGGVRPSLDHVATLERLEALSVPVLGYQTDHFPGFFVRESGVMLDHRVDSAAEIGEIANNRDAMQLQQAILVANALPKDLAYQRDEIIEIINSYVSDSPEEKTNAEGGRDIDYHASRPLLEYIGKMTNGRSWQINVEIYRRNAALGGEIAKVVTSRLDYTD